MVATETTPLQPAADAYAGKTQADMKKEKSDMLKGGLEDKMKMVDKDGDVEEGSGLPDGPLDRTCAPCRGNFLFHMCVAREPETPLNVLHMMQPTMVVLLGLGMLLCSAIVLPVNIAMYLVIFGQAASAVGMLFVGIVVKDIPSQEKLNVELNKKIGKMGGMVDDLEEHGDTAGQLASMTIGWVAARAETRDRMRQLRDMLQTSQGEYYSFRFRYQLLLKLAAGEQARFRVEESNLKKNMEDKTMREYNEAYSKILPDGLMNEEELTTVAMIIKDSTDEGGGLESKVDDIIEQFIKHPTEVQLEKFTRAEPYLLKLKRLKDKRGEPMPEQFANKMERAMEDEKRYSMKTVVDMITFTAKEDYKKEYEASISPWLEQFEKEKQEKAAEAEEQYGAKSAIGKK